MEKVDGFYWVRLYGKWTIGEYCSPDWILIGSDELLKEDLFDCIGERIEERKDNNE